MKPKTLEHLLGTAAAAHGISVEDLCERGKLNERTLRRLRRENTDVREGTIAQIVAITGCNEKDVRKAIAASRKQIAEQKSDSVG